MALDNLAPDQRALLQLVLAQGQSFAEIASVLGIETPGIRSRAHAAVDAIAPDDARRVSDDRRAEIADYLLRQLDASAADAVYAHLSASEGARNWAEAVAGALAPLAREPLPVLPAAAPPVAPEPAPVSLDPAPVEPAVVPRPPVRRERPAPRERAGAPQTSRTGGILLLAGLGALVLVVVALVVFTGDDDDGGGSASNGTTATQSTTTPRVEAQINLEAGNAGGDAKGIAQVLSQDGQRALAIVAQDVEPNNRDAYAVWLYNSRDDAQLLGFIPNAVGDDGRLSGVAGLPEEAANFDELVLTRERVERPRRPGGVVLRGPIDL